MVLQDGEIYEGLKCSYCELLLKDPVQTTESGLRLCRTCFEGATKLVINFMFKLALYSSALVITCFKLKLLQCLLL